MSWKMVYSTLTMKMVYSTLTIVYLLLQSSEPSMIEYPVITRQISVAEAFNKSLDFLTMNECDLEANDTLCSLTTGNDDSSRWYPPPPPLPPKLLDCLPSFKTDCDVIIPDGGGEAGKKTQNPKTSAVGILVAVACLFSLLIFSSLIGILLKRKIRARIAPCIDCGQPSAAPPAADSLPRAERAKPPASPTSPKIKNKMASIVAMTRARCEATNGTWNCWMGARMETNNNEPTYDNNASELARY